MGGERGETDRRNKKEIEEKRDQKLDINQKKMYFCFLLLLPLSLSLLYISPSLSHSLTPSLSHSLTPHTAKENDSERGRQRERRCLCSSLSLVLSSLMFLLSLSLSLHEVNLLLSFIDSLRPSLLSLLFISLPTLHLCILSFIQCVSLCASGSF